jgi:hypothetical protein
MPRTPYVIIGLVKDVDGSTTFYPGSIKIIDVTLGESLTGSVASDGSFSIDIANLTSAYSNGDGLQVVIYNSRASKSTEFRHTVNTGLPGYDAGTLYMHWTKPILGTATVVGGVMSNKSAGALTVDFYDRKYDDKKLSLDVPATNSISIPMLFKGIEFEEGICIIRESDAANSVEVQLVVK